MMQALRRPDQSFGRHAADVDTGPADRAMADERDLRALLGRRDGRREPGRAGSNHREVVALAVAAAAVAHWVLGSVAILAG